MTDKELDIKNPETTLRQHQKRDCRGAKQNSSHG